MLGLMMGLYAQARQKYGIPYRLREIGDLTEWALAYDGACGCTVCSEVARMRKLIPLSMDFYTPIALYGFDFPIRPVLPVRRTPQ